MQLEIQPYEKAQPIVFNYEELKTQIREKLKIYANLQYTPEQITSAKADRAALNSLHKALNDERIRREREFLEPFNLFKAQINELVTLIDEPCKLIDKQVKEFEEMEKREKREKCIDIFNDVEDKPDWLRFEQIENVKWQNKTTSEKSIRDEIINRIKQINGDIAILNGLEFAFEALDEYKRSLDASRALAEGKRLAELQVAKEQALKSTETPEIPFAEGEVVEITADEEKGVEDRIWVSFRCLISKADALELKAFFTTMGIPYEPIGR